MLDKMVKEGIVEKSGNRRGVYRIKQDNFEVMDFDIEETNIINLKWPLGIETMYKCYPGSIAVLAGAPASGKTTFGLNLIFDLRNFIKDLFFVGKLPL